jgi:pyruvate/2-oxoglutarate dehydrogenase complex dihydrolipoamide acyltransferase (E2) component
MLFYYFVPVPWIPKEHSHKNNDVEIKQYKVKEGQIIKTGDVIAEVENWWASFYIKATTDGKVSKIFFSKGTHVAIGDPIAIIVGDPEDMPKDAVKATLELKDVKKEKPLHKRPEA